MRCLPYVIVDLVVQTFVNVVLEDKFHYGHLCLYPFLFRSTPRFSFFTGNVFFPRYQDTQHRTCFQVSLDRMHLGLFLKNIIMSFCM